MDAATLEAFQRMALTGVTETQFSAGTTLHISEVWTKRAQHNGAVLECVFQPTTTRLIACRFSATVETEAFLPELRDETIDYQQHLPRLHQLVTLGQRKGFPVCGRFDVCPAAMFLIQDHVWERLSAVKYETLIVPRSDHWLLVVHEAGSVIDVEDIDSIRQLDC